MRIGIFTFRITDRPTGLANYARSLSYALADLDDHVEVILLNPHPESKLQWYRDFATWPLRSTSEPSSYGYILATAPFRLRKAAKKMKLDVLHAPGNVAPFIGPRSGTARVATVHDVAPLALPAEHRARARLAYWVGVPPLRWTADAVIADSAAAARDISRYAKLSSDLLHVVHIGTDSVDDAQIQERQHGAAAVTRSLGVSGPYFLVVGDLRPRKNVARVVQAFREVQMRHPDSHLIVIGQQMHRGEEITRAAEGVPGVVFAGYVTDAQRAALYAGAQALVFPSLYEGFGLPILEAMAVGTPVITSDRSSMPEVAGGAALLIDPYDTEAIVTAMTRVLTDRDLATQLSRAGVNRARELTWESTARQTLAIYRKVAGHGQHSRLVPDSIHGHIADA